MSHLLAQKSHLFFPKLLQQHAPSQQLLLRKRSRQTSGGPCIHSALLGRGTAFPRRHRRRRRAPGFCCAPGLAAAAAPGDTRDCGPPPLPTEDSRDCGPPPLPSHCAPSPSPLPVRPLPQPPASFRAATQASSDTARLRAAAAAGLRAVRFEVQQPFRRLWRSR